MNKCAGGVSLIQIRSQTSQSWVKHKDRIIAFIKAYGNQRITLATLHALQSLSPKQFTAVGDRSSVPAAVVTVSSQGKLLGVAFATDDGSGCCLIVVHPKARRQNIGYQLMGSLIQHLEHFSCHVAVDNISSLALCFKHGLHAVSIHEGPTGKNTLRFERSSSHGSSVTRHLNIVSQ